MNTNPTEQPGNDPDQSGESSRSSTGTEKQTPVSHGPTSGTNRELSWLLLLRLLLVLDSAVLLALGAAFIFTPKQVLLAFHFRDLPDGVSYIVGLWGCVLFTMAIGYAVAATNPIRHLIWVKVAIARGALEAILGVVYLVRGVVTWKQSVFGIVVAVLMTIAYLALYPRKRRDIRPVES